MMKQVSIFLIPGHCECDADFGGADCSVNITMPPKFWRLHMNGFCDISEESCKEIVVYGDDFYKSDALVCELQRIEVSRKHMLKALKMSKEKVIIYHWKF